MFLCHIFSGSVCMDGIEGEGELVAASDHYAKTLDIEFRYHKGGRRTKGKCVGGHKNRNHRGKKRRP